jgi:ribonuclease VapC
LNDADATAALALLDLPVIPFDATQAHRVAALRGPTRARGLSLGDRACLALAAELNAVALTMDRVWTTLNLDIGIECARPETI